MAMKLAVCIDWAEIFFLCSCHSLMGDTPESIGPVIVSPCVVLEDETLETQVDGMVSKVRRAINHALFIK